MRPTILLVGLGGLGSVILELLCRERGLEARIVVATRRAGRGLARCNLARLGALAQGFAPDVSFLPLDLEDGDSVAGLVQQLSPDLLLSTATMQTWWLPDLLPPGPAAAIRSAGFGVWLPVHLSLTLKLMRALRAGGYVGLTLTAPFPDAINCVLGRLGLAPTCGVGNLDEIVPKVRWLAARQLGVPLASVRVLLVAHHALERYALAPPGRGPAGEVPPYFLRVEYDGEDVTEALLADELLLSPYPVSGGPPSHFLTAGSTVRLLRALLAKEETLLHAPGPHGLPGGYPVIAGRGQLRLAPIEGLSPEEAVSINERSHRFDGIERIEPDGTVVFVPESADVLRRELGYDCPRLHPDEAAGRAEELSARFRAYAARHGVDLP
ncbi:MAG: hypothetical protein JXA37_06405 [Chloroflexia bacterium]|nr:hypothetical protein [Chloroflexia bacterium]